MKARPALRKKFGANVRKARKQIIMPHNNKEMTQVDLAGLIETDKSYIGFVERGERNPTLDMIGRLADALKVKPKDLFDF